MIQFKSWRFGINGSRDLVLVRVSQEIYEKREEISTGGDGLGLVPPRRGALDAGQGFLDNGSPRLAVRDD